MVYTKLPKLAHNNSLLLLIALLSLVFWSCSNQSSEKSSYSPEFKKIFDEVNRVSDKDPYNGIKYLDSAFNKIKKPTVSDNFRRLAFHYVLASRANHDYKIALLYADSMLAYINHNGGQQKFPSNYAEAHFAKGDAYFDLQNYNDAYQCYFIGYRVGKNYLDNQVISGYSYRMGMITYQQAHYNLAIKYFQDSYRQTVPYDKDFVAYYRNQEVLDNIALAYRHMNKADSALTYFKKAIAYIDKNSPLFPDKAKLLKVAHAVVYGNEADIYIKSNRYPEAIDLLKKSITINLQKGNDNSDALLSEMKLAKIYAAQKQDQLLNELLHQVQEQLKTIVNKKAESDWYMLMSDHYIKTNQPVLAIKYNRRYNALKDSLLESTRLLKETNVGDQLDNYEKQYEIESLTYNNKIQRIYLMVFFALAIMALVIILLIYRNGRRSKKDLVIVNKLNSEINRQKVDLENTLHKLNESSREKDRILHTVAHDLRNPLGGIASLTNVMTTDEDITPEQKEYIHIIKETADNSLELINEIFEATDSILDEPKLQSVDINLLLNNTVELLRFKAAEKGQQIILNTLAPSETLMVGREKIWRVISNLIINAIKFSPVGSSIVVEATRTNDNICLAIKDNGIGIPEDMKPKVFNMFTEAKRTGTMGEKSFGLGLSICYQIIEKYHGKIWFESNPEGGTTFYVSLKRNLADVINEPADPDTSTRNF